MKKIISILLAFCVFGLLYAFNIQSGGEIGATASPGEGTCNACHGGGPAGTTVSITSSPSFSANVFDPSITYTITISVGHPSLTHFGFDCEILDATNANAGSMANAGSGVWLLNAGARQNATHNAPKAGSGSANFTFVWTPPMGGSATIYVSGNAVNFDGNTTGDFSTTSSLALTSLDTGLPVNTKDQVSQVSIFPNPVNDITTISYYLLSPQKITIDLIDISGKVIKTFINETEESGPHSNILDLKGISNGIYFIKISSNGERLSQKLISVR